MSEALSYHHPEEPRGEPQARPIKKILKISEMALSVDGEYLGEVGNPTYREKKDMFFYDPQDGLLVSGQRESLLLTKDDLARVPHAVGHVTIERLLGNESRRYSDREFERKLYEICNDTENKIKKITFIGELMGIDWSNQDTDFCINRVASRNPEFSPEELQETILEKLKDEYQRQHREDQAKQDELAQAIESLKKTGVLEIDSQKSREGIVSYFYLYCTLKGIDASNSDTVYEAFDGFLFLDELMKEYERQADGRFGDGLLIACSRQKAEQDKEQGAENRD